MAEFYQADPIIRPHSDLPTYPTEATRSRSPANHAQAGALVAASASHSTIPNTCESTSVQHSQPWSRIFPLPWETNDGISGSNVLSGVVSRWERGGSNQQTRIEAKESHVDRCIEFDRIAMFDPPKCRGPHVRQFAARHPNSHAVLAVNHASMKSPCGPFAAVDSERLFSTRYARCACPSFGCLS
ncbi:MAG: hypothetical protein Q9214_000803 [Letrouitia sp. 1 TL-2023]